MIETLKVLVVDDEPGMRMGVQRALRNFSFAVPDINGDVHFDVDEAATGEDALAHIAADSPDILLLDYKLPGINGLDVLERIDAQSHEILTVMITAYASLDTAVTATKRGAYDFLAKPFTPEELKCVIRKAARQLLVQRQARRLAEEKRQVRFQFISVLAHELKAPISAVQGFLKLIRDHSAGDDPKAYEHMLDRSMARLDGMHKMILDLLDLTRIESGQKKRDIAELDLRDIAQHSVESFTPQASERDITIRLDAPERVPFTGDRVEMEIVLNNLVSNAVKYNRDGGKVDIALRPENHGVTLSVSDTGIGMSEQERARLFQEFTRIKNDKTRRIMGSGLGLSIVKKIAVLYAGDVEVQSEPDVGTTFTVTLEPQDPESTQQEDEPSTVDAVAD